MLFQTGSEEKYLFLPQGVRVTNFSGVIEIAMMNAVPFPSSTDEPVRFAVGWAADGPRYVGISDEKARDLLRAHGLEKLKPMESLPIHRPPPEPDWFEELKRKYPQVRAEVEAAERAERERKSRIAARVGELSRAATSETVATDARPQPTPAGEDVDASSRRGPALWAVLGAAFLAVTAGIILRRRRG